MSIVIVKKDGKGPKNRVIYSSYMPVNIVNRNGRVYDKGVFKKAYDRFIKNETIRISQDVLGD